MINAGERRDARGEGSGTDGSREVAILDAAAEEKERHVRVVVPGAAVSGPFCAGDGVGSKDEEDVAAALGVKGPLHLLKELRFARLKQLVAREGGDDVRLS